MEFSEQVKRWLKDENLIWRHDGDLAQPHAEWSSHLHATGYAQIRELLSDIDKLSSVAQHLFYLIESSELESFPDRIMGSGTSSIGLAAFVAQCYADRYGEMLWGYTNKAAPDGSKMHCGFNIGFGEQILFVEDLISTGHTTAASMKAVLERQPAADIILAVGCVLSWQQDVFTENLQGFSVIPILTDSCQVWKPEACELCAAGSQALRPKFPGNWEKLTKGG